MSWNSRIVGSDMVDPSILCPNPKNWRRHPKHQQDAMTNVFNEIGWIQDIIVNKTTGNIIDGHMRAELAVKNKEKLVPVKYVELTPDEERQALISYDPLSALAEQDNDMLKQLLGDISDNIDMSKFDFGKDVLNSMRPHTDEEINDVPPAPDTPTTKLGDIYHLGNHVLMCGDSTSSEDVGKLMDGKKADMLLTDPPYNIDYTGGTKDKLKILNDKMADLNFREFLASAFRNANANMRAGAVFYIWHAGLEGYNFIGACHDIGWTIREYLIWKKNSLVMGRQDYQWMHEPCLYGWVDGGPHLWCSDRKQTTVIEYNKPTVNALHPTMKPVGLFDYLIMNNTYEHAIVLDLFAGSGTTLIACEENNRIAYCMELSPQYCDVIINRWEKLTGKKAELVSEVD